MYLLRIFASSREYDRRSEFNSHQIRKLLSTVMSARLTPRPYQLDAAAEVIDRNTVVNIRTGGGKTLIAAVVIDTFIKSSQKLVCFIVPSRALVSQQASFLRRNCQQKQGKHLRVAGNVFTQPLYCWAMPRVIQIHLVSRAKRLSSNPHVTFLWLHSGKSTYSDDIYRHLNQNYAVKNMMLGTKWSGQIRRVHMMYSWARQRYFAVPSSRRPSCPHPPSV